jgi:N-ethylmaleimide reductase
MIKELLTPIQLGAVTLKNRMVMAPLTRMRANSQFVPTDLNAQYYAQRASAGMIISEATQISQQGMGYPSTPGIYTPAQVEGWKKVTGSVHAKDGLIFMQLWHVGRISHSSHQPGNSLPVAPSAIAATGSALTADWQSVPFEVPHALEISEIKAIIADYRQAALNAKEAGFDGVELHSANGYLLNQFLHADLNQRTDEYGGSVENRSRLLFEILDILVEIWGSDKIGIRFSPFFTGSNDQDPKYFETYSYVFTALGAYDLAYIHLIRYRPAEEPDQELFEAEKELWDNYEGHIIAADGFTPESAEEAIVGKVCDAVAFGRLFIANPDLPERVLEGGAMNEYDRNTFYGGDEKGYIDYPFLTYSS